MSRHTKRSRPSGGFAWSKRSVPEVLGISFDPVNVLVRLEDPVAAARRVAPYVHHVHVDDAVVIFVDDGLERKLYPPGEGFVD